MCILHHVNTLWLFTYSELKTIVGPSTLFGIVSALAGPTLMTTSEPSIAVLTRIPMVAFWAWINLLPFAIANQRRPEAIREDSLNKPWRPLPSKRLDSSQALVLICCFYPTPFLLSVYIGGVRQYVALVMLGLWYNELRGGDQSCIIRNVINGCGYICYTSGALEVALSRSQAVFRAAGYQWLSMIGAVVFSTIHSQDLYDQYGDCKRNRRTVPLVIGDLAARRTIAGAVLLWPLLCPAFWQLPWYGYIAPVLLAVTIAWRLLLKTTVEDDKRTFRAYNLWIVSLYFLPLIKYYDVNSSQYEKGD